MGETGGMPRFLGIFRVERSKDTRQDQVWGVDRIGNEEEEEVKKKVYGRKSGQ